MPLDDTGWEDRIGSLGKINRVIDLLATQDRWCQGCLVSPDGRRCLMGAVQEVNGADSLIRPISLAIRQVTGRRFGQIERFNDDPETTHDLVLSVLFQARNNVINSMAAASDSKAASGRAAGWWRATLQRCLRLR
jgi:hypothetical protein